MSTTMPKPLAWTGERMVPTQSDVATELYHWQRYLYFRPWYQGAKVIDAASGEGYGSNYASAFAEWVKGYDLSDEAVAHAENTYPHAGFEVADVCEADYSDADLVVSFETIEHVPDPVKFLRAVKTCKGRIVISTPNRKTHSPGNNLEDKPYNQFHTIEWTPNEFAELIQAEFPDREVRFLSQQGQWPGLIKEGLDDDAMYCIAVIGEGELPKWPRIGISIPTHNNSAQLSEAVMNLSRFYPGEMEFAVVANGSNPAHLQSLQKLRDAMPYMLHLIEEPENLGYGVGANTGLNHLWQESWFDYYGVINDDVLPATDCVNEMVNAMQELEKLGHKPGVVGPVSNNIHGAQQVNIGNFQDFGSMNFVADRYHHEHVNSATPVAQLRGLFMLIHPEVLNTIGGFDPVFGIGNFEDDDYNLRTRLAGFTTWIADGAFLFHHGSTTFKTMQVDYNANIQRNAETLASKWNLAQLEDWITLEEKPENVDIFVPLWKKQDREFEVKINGEPVDLIRQASDVEFAAWVMNRIGRKTRDVRRAVVQLLVDENAA